MSFATATRYAAILCAMALAGGCSSMYDAEMTKSEGLRVEHLGREVNGPYDEISPLLLPGGAESDLVFASNRPLRENGEEIDKLYAASLGADGRWTAATRLETGASPEVKEGMLVRGGGQALLVQCYRADGVGDCDLCTATVGRGADGRPAVSQVRVLPAPLNDREWDSQPALSPDGSTLVFASERYGGTGQSDLWMSRRAADGTWSDPVNLGSAVNTGGNEIAPSFSPDGTTLYFSSDGREGYGGLDVFSTTLAAGRWTAPAHLRAPANSPGDDAFYTVCSADTAFVASNRSGGFGGFDVYLIAAVRKPAEPVKQPLVVHIVAKNAFTQADIPAALTLTEDATQLEIVSDTGGIRQQILPLVDYTVTGYLSGYQSKVETFSYEAGAQGTRERALPLVPVTESERTIYAFTVEFDFSLFNIRPEEEKQLDSVVTLLTRFPNSTVVVAGHTDSVGTVSYNIKLGYNRAKEVSNYVLTYLHQRKVSLRNDMEIRTYGESEPVATNSTDEGRQRNRRVEISIVRNE